MTATHTNNRMEKHWEETRLFIKKTWPKFTDVELKRINGDYDTFLDYLKEYYNNFPFEEAAARAKLQKLFNELDERYPERI